MTNFERIKKMNEQELAELIETFIDCCCCPYGSKCDGDGEDEREDCIGNLTKWLKSEYVLTFRDVKVGERFISNKDKTYIKILECHRNGELINAVELNSGHLVGFNEDKEIVK